MHDEFDIPFLDEDSGYAFYPSPIYARPNVNKFSRASSILGHSTKLLTNSKDKNYKIYKKIERIAKAMGITDKKIICDALTILEKYKKTKGIFSVDVFYYCAAIYIAARLNGTSAPLDYVEGIKYGVKDVKKVKSRLFNTVYKISTAVAPIKGTFNEAVARYLAKYAEKLKFDDRMYAKALNLAIKLRKLSNTPRPLVALSAYLVYNAHALLTNKQLIGFTDFGISWQAMIRIRRKIKELTIYV